ncbi:MAG TPA: hypothetical protein VMU81_30840 [Acetobacteraceae bacterium]|nr:hypothetical protein [Acetobacteraceae bacterium]
MPIIAIVSMAEKSECSITIHLPAHFHGVLARNEALIAIGSLDVRPSLLPGQTGRQWSIISTISLAEAFSWHLPIRRFSLRRKSANCADAFWIEVHPADAPQRTPSSEPDPDRPAQIG